MAVAGFVACDRHPADAGLAERVESSLNAALRFIVSRQSDDGSWRSDVYGTLRDGVTLTPPILKLLTFAASSVDTDRNHEFLAARDHAAQFMASVLDESGRPRQPPDFPVYTAALTSIALSRIGGREFEVARDHWLAELRSHQLTEALGWSEDDLAYGGWGYSVLPLRHPSNPSVRAPFDADLSSTLFAVSGLRLTGTSAQDLAIRRARMFVFRCQNFNDDGGGDPDYDDGGFFLTPTNEAQNKAGMAGVDHAGRRRFHSYGSATADGLRALIRCGLPMDHPRVIAARRWLEKNFSATTNPGTFDPVLEHDRGAAYYYWCWSVAHAFRLVGVTHVNATTESDAMTSWSTLLAEALLRRQCEDGRFENAYSFVKEDDPLIATSLALGALSACSQVLWTPSEPRPPAPPAAPQTSK